MMNRKSRLVSRWDKAAMLRMLSLLDRLHIWERWPHIINGIQVKMAALYGAVRAAEQTRLFVAQSILHLACICAGSLVLGAVSGPPMLQAGLILALLYPWYAYKKLETRVRMRQRLIVLELPELLNKLTLLVNAGETIYQAIHRCASAQADPVKHPLQAEWAKLSRELRDNKPFVFAMEDFSRACGVLEVSMFATSVLLNFKRGGSDFVNALQELSHTLWERRKAIAKTVGEEASSKLVFPMVILFLAVMVLVAAPALLMMN